MRLGKPKSKFESEVHLGLLVIVCLLLFLNVASNFIIYRARSTQLEETDRHLRKAALSVSRIVQEAYPSRLSAAALKQVETEQGLSGLMLVSSRPSENSTEAKREWFKSVIAQLPPTQLPEIARKLFNADLNELTRGSEDQYYYLYPIPAGAGHDLLVLTVDRSGLAYLDDSRTTILFVQLGALGIVGIVYFVLSQFIFKPFRKLKRRAAEAGRKVEDSDDEAEAIVREYERVIDKLKENEATLVELNEAIQNRADSLEQFNQYLLESGHAGVITFDPDGIVVAANEKALEMLDVGSDRAEERHYTDLLGGLGRLLEDIGRVIEDDTAAGYREYRHLFGRQSETVLGVSFSTIRDKKQRIVGYLVFINDLTELDRLRRELEGKNRLVALGEMASGLAHQMRNSLGAISGYAGLIRRGQSRDGQSTERADILINEAREAESLISRFLTFARPFDFCPEPTSLNALLADSIDQFRVREDCREVEFRFDAAEDILIEGDAVLLKQVFGNIIDNAVKSYGGAAGVVEVGVCSDRGSAVVMIGDTGSGIDEEILERIFTPFYSTRPSGTGLGLSLAQKIMNAHSGSLSVESEPGRGTQFSVRIPLASQGQPVTAEPEIIA